MGNAIGNRCAIVLAATALTACSGVPRAPTDVGASGPPPAGSGVAKSSGSAALGSGGPEQVGTYEIVAVHPHDPGAYTQGLLFHDGYLYEGTGRYGSSRVRKVDPRSGEVLQQVALPTNYFGEGIAILGERIFQLTWLSHRGFIYDLETFERLGEFGYDTEGWGLTSDGESLIMSDGSDTLLFLAADDQRVVRTVTVRDGDEPVDDLNELELVDGLVYANVWHSDFVYRIDPGSGAVVDRIDFSGLLAGERPTDPDAVLNGIAHDPATGHLFLTGKLWPKLFEVRLLEPTASAGPGVRR